MGGGDCGVAVVENGFFVVVGFGGEFLGFGAGFGGDFLGDAGEAVGDYRQLVFQLVVVLDVLLEGLMHFIIQRIRDL